MVDNRLVTFLTLLEEKNYTKTANKLYITQPAVTHHINSLQDELNIIIFSDKKTFELTKNGYILYEYALRMKEEDELLKNSLFKSTRDDPEKYEITQTAFYLFKCNNKLFDIYNFFIGNELNIKNSSMIFDSISTGRIDYGIIDSSFDSQVFESIPIINEPISLAVYKNGKFFNKDRITREQLNSNVIIYPDNDSGLYNTIQQSLKNKNLKIKSHEILYTNNPIIMADMIIKYDGIGFMYNSTAKFLEGMTEIKTIELLNYNPKQFVYLIYNKLTSKRNAINIINNLIKELLE